MQLCVLFIYFLYLATYNFLDTGFRSNHTAYFPLGTRDEVSHSHKTGSIFIVSIREKFHN